MVRNPVVKILLEKNQQAKMPLARNPRAKMLLAKNRRAKMSLAKNPQAKMLEARQEGKARRLAGEGEGGDYGDESKIKSFCKKNLVMKEYKFVYWNGLSQF